MKTIYNFMYCDGVLTSQTVHYVVMVGRSERELRAASFVSRLAKTTASVYFHINDNDGAKFMELVRQSLKTDVLSRNSFNVMRCVVCNVVDLARFLRSAPMELLNSTCIESRGLVACRVQRPCRAVHVR